MLSAVVVVVLEIRLLGSAWRMGEREEQPASQRKKNHRHFCMLLCIIMLTKAVGRPC